MIAAARSRAVVPESLRPRYHAASLSPVAPIIGTLLGLAAAWLTLPNDVAPAGALRLPATLFTMGLFLGCIHRVRRHGISQLFRCEWAVITSIFYFVLLDVIQGLYDIIAVRREAILQEFIAIALFSISLHLVTARSPRNLPRVFLDTAARKYSVMLLTRVLVACFILGMFYFAFMSGFSVPVMIEGLTADRWSAPWSRAAIGDWYSFVEQLHYFGYLLPTITVLIAVRHKWWSVQAVSGMILSAIYLPFVVQGGGRRILGMCIGAALFTYLCAKRHDLRPRHLAAFVLIAATTLVAMDVMLSNRNHGAIEFNYDLGEFKNVRVDDNFLRLAQVLDIIPEYQPHVGFQMLLYVAARPVPRVFWPNKPVSVGFDLATYLGDVGVAWSSTVIAEWYMAFGWLGIVICGCLYGWMCRFWSQLLEYPLPITSVAIYSIGMMAMVISIRGFIELILMSYPLWSWIVLDRLVFRSSGAVAPEMKAR